jgi:hypothetical protein
MFLKAREFSFPGSIQAGSTATLKTLRQKIERRTLVTGDPHAWSQLKFFKITKGVLFVFCTPLNQNLCANMADYYAAPSEEDFDRLNRQVVCSHRISSILLLTL